MRGRADGEEVQEHRLAVAAVVVGDEAGFGVPPHADARRPRRGGPRPVHAAVERVRQGADLRLARVVAAVVLRRGEDAHHQQPGVDGGKLHPLEPVPRVHVQEVIEEAVVPRGPAGRRPLRRVPEEAQRGERAVHRVGPRHPSPLHPHRVRRQPEPHGRHAAERGRGPAVGHQPVARVGRLPEPAEGALLQRIQERLPCRRRGRPAAASRRGRARAGAERRGEERRRGRWIASGARPGRGSARRGSRRPGRTAAPHSRTHALTYFRTSARHCRLNSSPTCSRCGSLMVQDARPKFGASRLKVL